jgi:hypothetical protein
MSLAAGRRKWIQCQPSESSEGGKAPHQVGSKVPLIRTRSLGKRKQCPGVLSW